MLLHPSARGRWIVAAGAGLLVLACLLKWWQIGGEAGGLSARSDIGLSDGRGFLIFLAAVATLLLVTLPYAAATPVAIDHPIVYLSLFLVMLGAYAWRTIGLIVEQSVSILPIPPQNGPGYWLAGIGLVIYARGVFELFELHRRR
jgi:hypothetical protein